MRLSIKKIITLIISFTMLGIIIGLFLDGSHLITFDYSINLSVIISILGIIVTIFIMPFIIDDIKNNEKRINDISLKDLDDICKEIDKLRDYYGSFLSNSCKIEDSQKAIIIDSFKKISSMLYMLSEEFKRCHVCDSFKEDVIADTYTRAYESCTEKLLTKDGLDTNDIKAAQSELNSFHNSIKQTRYKLFK